jgi:hypothetical protein
MTVAASGASPTMRGGSLPTAKLAYQDLFYGRLSGIVTPVGIVFWVVPVAVQFARRLGSQDRIAVRLDRPQAKLWVVLLLPGHEKRAILSAPGIAGMEVLAVGFVAERKLSDGATAALLVGSDARHNRSLPWDITAGSLTELTSPIAVAVDAIL